MTSNGPGAGGSGVGGGVNPGGISGNPGGVRGSCGRRITFDNVGGLEDHVKVLKEILLLPLMYREVYTRFSIKPPRGVLFYGPPGTGKTLVAGALANECSRNADRKVTFFSRKGADCYSKYVGESEQKLRAIFEEAKQQQPSIIFFDEIDGLAPTRSSRHDIVHASVVSTLLALMDGLDTSFDVVVIGATNRIDAIDPALRRPGRFDRELYFPLPALQAREQILQVHLRHWRRPPSDIFIQQLAASTVGYCGSDLQALCAEAVLCGLRRVYPDIYNCSVKQRINFTALRIEERDFIAARRKIVAASKRVIGSPVKRLAPGIRPLLEEPLARAIRQLEDRCPFTTMPFNGIETCETDDASCLPCPSLLLIGQYGQGQTTHLAPALLHHLEHLPTTVLDIAALFEHSGRGTEEACINRIKQASQHMPAVLYLPEVTSWWHLVDEATRAVFVALTGRLDSTMPILLLGTAQGKYEDLSKPLKNLWRESEGQVFILSNPSDLDREAFFKEIFLERTTKPPPRNPHPEELIIRDRTGMEKDEQRMIGFVGEEENGEITREVDVTDCTYGSSDSDDKGSVSDDENEFSPNSSAKSIKAVKCGRSTRRKRALSNASGRRTPVHKRARSRAATHGMTLRARTRQWQAPESSRFRSRSRSSSRCRTRRSSQDRYQFEETFGPHGLELFASGAMSNASENTSSGHEMAEDTEVPVTDLRSGKPPSGVIIDTAELLKLLERAVRITANQPVRTLEALHAALADAIIPFESRVDRRSLPKVLSGVLEKFEESIKASNTGNPDENAISTDFVVSIDQFLQNSRSRLLDDNSSQNSTE